jgi:hypothetical protein
MNGKDEFLKRCQMELREWEQLCDVAISRVDANPAVIKMLYLDSDKVPEPMKDVFQALLDEEITPEQAKDKILELKEN